MTHTSRYKIAQRKLSGLIIEHPHFTAALNELQAQAEFSLPGHVFVVHGPPGAGVSALVGKFTRSAVMASTPENRYHAVQFAVPEAQHLSRRWSGLWENGLRAINAPLIGQKRRASESIVGLTVYQQNAVFTPGDSYRYAFQRGLQERGSRYLCVTNAHALTKGLKDDDLGFPLKVFHQLSKSSNQAPACVVLGGHSRILESLAVSAHANLHATEIELKAYSADSTADQASFAGVLAEFERSVGDVLANGTLVHRSEQVYQRTLGSIGWVKRALNHALAVAEHVGDKQVKWALVEQALPATRDRNLIRKELDLRNSLSRHSPINYVVTKAKQTSQNVGVRAPGEDPVGKPGGGK